MKRSSTIVAIAALALVQACTAQTQEEQDVINRQVACAGGTVMGALIGGAVGNQFGGGTGNDLLTAGGAAAGAVAGGSVAC